MDAFLGLSSLLFAVAILGSPIYLIYYFIKSRNARLLNKSTLDAEIQRLRDALTKLSLDHSHLSTVKNELDLRVAELVREVERLSPFSGVADTDAHIKQLIDETDSYVKQVKTAAEVALIDAKETAEAILSRAQDDAADIRKKANQDASQKREKSDGLIAAANRQAEQLIKDAEQRAAQIAGDAYKALQEADQLEKTAKAMRNLIEGYGDSYLKPTYSILDELAEAYSFDEAGQQLKDARERSKLMVSHKRAATCEYVDASKKDTAIKFVLDAFNGKVDSILSRTKTDNHGKLEAEIQDAFSLTNHTGSAFRNARITAEYLNARLMELKWLVSVNLLKEQEKEEQRQIREQIREEEKARREIEKALRDAAKEEEAIQKAMERMRTQIDKATDEQRIQFEIKLAELQGKLSEAEERNKRALSMAQQTKSGHVYIISNVGSFGENIYKIGMTRRLEPLDRVKELGDASVPFEFDVHAMIWSDDAPGLEFALHKTFLQAQVNKVNPRKEFFRLPLNDIRKVIGGRGIETSWTMAARAAQYKESLAIEQRIAENPELAKDWLKHQEDMIPEADSIQFETEEA